jgi:Cell division protein CrgA
MARSTARSRGRKSKGAERSGSSARRNHGTGRVTPKASARYTPPVPREQKVSPTWYPYLIVGLLLAGLLCIVLNYLGVLPGGASNWYLLVGLVLIAAGFLTATGYR